MGRFFQEDTYLGNITDPLTLNRYAYVKNSPLNYMDPSGHKTKSNMTLEQYYNQLSTYTTGNNSMGNSNSYAAASQTHEMKEYISSLDTYIARMLNWVKDLSAKIPCELGQEIASTLTDIILGFGYSFVDNILIQTAGWGVEHIGGASRQEVEQWEESIEQFVIDNGVNDNAAFYVGQVVGDAFQTAFALTKLPMLFKNMLSAMDTLIIAFKKAFAAGSTGGGSFQLAGTGITVGGWDVAAVIEIAGSLGVSAADALELIGEIGAVGAGVLYMAADVTGAGKDINKLSEAVKHNLGGSGGPESKKSPTADELAKLADNSGKIDGLSGTNVEVNTAMEAGQKFVGKGYKTTLENGMIKYTNKYGTKSFRIMTKKMKGVYEANFEMFDSAGNKLTNYHVGIIED